MNYLLHTLEIKNIGEKLRLKIVFVVPQLKRNLISVSKFVEDNACSVKFTDKGFVVKDKRTRIVLEKGNRRHDLYALEESLHEALIATKIDKNSGTVWNQRLGHPHSRILNYLQSSKMIDVRTWSKNFF